MNREVEDVLRLHGGVVGIRQYPELARAMHHVVTRGVLTAVLPGTFVHRDLIGDWRVLVGAEPQSRWRRHRSRPTQSDGHARRYARLLAARGAENMHASRH